MKIHYWGESLNRPNIQVQLKMKVKKGRTFNFQMPQSIRGKKTTANFWKIFFQKESFFWKKKSAFQRPSNLRGIVKLKTRFLKLKPSSNRLCNWF